MTTSRWTKRAGAAAVLVVAAAALAAVGAGQASAAGAVKVGATSASTSVNKNLTATCPAGTVVTGGGGYLTSPAGAHQGHVSLVRLEPLNSGAGFVAGMNEVGVHLPNWQLSTDAICMPEPAGWDVISSTAPQNTQVSTVSCDTKNVIGVGGRINNGGGNVVLDYVVPSVNLKTVTVRGTVVSGNPTGWSVTAFAVCANTSAPDRVSFAAPTSSSPHVGLNWSCPAGDELYSAGAMVSPGSGEVFLSLVRTVTTTSFAVAADEDASGYGLNWTLVGYGICGP